MDYLIQAWKGGDTQDTEGLRSLAQDGPITVRSNQSESEVFCKYTRVGS